MADSARFWTVFLLITGAILFIGWSEPLRYRFMSRQEIENELHPKVEPTPAPAPPSVAKATPNWMWDPNRKTRLDEGTYNQYQSAAPVRRTIYATPYPTR